MKTLTLYNDLGQTMGVITGSDVDQVLGYHCVEGSYDNAYYIDQGQPVLKTPNPSTQHTVYEFDYQTKSWALDLVKTQHCQRQLRNSLLTEIDAISATRYASLTDSQQQELQAYRLALLAVPQQAGFPSQVEWPTKPQWL